MKDLPHQALTLISRARVLEKMIKDAMVDVPEVATLGELLRDNHDLFGTETHELRWAVRIRNGCAHVSRQEYSIVEIQQATDLFNWAIAEMNGSPQSSAENPLSGFYDPGTPYIFSTAFFADVFCCLVFLLCGIPVILRFL